MPPLPLTSPPPLPLASPPTSAPPPLHPALGRRRLLLRTAPPSPTRLPASSAPTRLPASSSSSSSVPTRPPASSSAPRSAASSSSSSAPTRPPASSSAPRSAASSSSSSAPHPAVGLLLRPHPFANSLEWEVLLAANSLKNLVVDDDDVGVETYFLDDADDMLFGQLAAEAEHEPPAKGGRPAANAAVEGLPTVVVAEADPARGDAQCAVCKDGIEAEEGARRLPCAHLYHDACILPWLAIRNTCPLCRHELPTDDPEYEKWKARRAGGGGNADANGDSDRYDVIRLP